MSNLNSNKAIEDYRSLLETIKISEEILENHKKMLALLKEAYDFDPDGEKCRYLENVIKEDEASIAFLQTLKSIDSQFVNLA